MLADRLLRWSSIHPTLVYCLLFNGWSSIIVLSIHVSLQLAKHILMLSHRLGRLSNFNCYVAHINPSMGLNASCFLFFWCARKHLPVISPACHSPVSFSHTLWHWHRKRWQALQTLGQQKSNIGSMLSACCA